MPPTGSRRASYFRVLQQNLGHPGLETTLVYLHLSSRGQEEAVARINELMDDLCEMDAIQEIFRRHEPVYLAEFGKTLPGRHARMIEAIIDCRSATSGSVRYQREDCGEPYVAARCCGNRHCPVCLKGKAKAGLSRQLDRQLPTPYFMLTFTVPTPLHGFLRNPPREG